MINDTAAPCADQLSLDDAPIPPGAYHGVEVADENTEPSWRDWAMDVLTQLAGTKIPFTADDLRRRGVDEPAHPNHWGPLFTAARRAGLIEPTGRVLPSTTVSRHGAIVREWRGVS